jgi:2-amino-4-hydroxy-6-hydroxymethyldihydropteridine diphosphokinase
MDHIVYVALGANLGDRQASLEAALAGLPPHVTVQRASRVYETLPWGITDQPSFLNMVIEGSTILSPQELLTGLKQLEIRLGRQETVHWGPRVIDLDILFFNDLVLDMPGLVIPHPHLHERAFVLVPLADLAPDLCHPVLHRTIRELLTAVDSGGVKLYE